MVSLFSKLECPEFKERSEEVKTKERRKHPDSNQRQRRKEEEEQLPYPLDQEDICKNC